MRLEKTASAALLAAMLAAPSASAQQTGAPAAQQPSSQAAPQAVPPAAPAPCAAPEMRQFDFWVGEWEIVGRLRTDKEKDTWTPEEKGTDSVRVVLDGCALLQEWRGIVGGQTVHGLSLTSYSPQTGEWQQAWSDNTAPMLYQFTGRMEGDRMVLTRKVDMGGGKTVLKRQVFYNIQRENFDWVYEESEDGGKTWHPSWKIRYKRKA